MDIELSRIIQDAKNVDKLSGVEYKIYLKSGNTRIIQIDGTDILVYHGWYERNFKEFNFNMNLDFVHWLRLMGC